ncbi:MAG: VWA domain-containing protein [bacterium]|nr:VWA domain-containing protein [bacterium]
MLAAEDLGFAIASPGWLWLLAVVVVVAVWRGRQRRGLRIALAGAVAVRGDAAGDSDIATTLGFGPLPRSAWQRFVATLPWLEAAALILAGFALARPVERVPLPPEREGADVLLALDVSSSMLSEDLGPGARTRLDLVLAAGEEFLARRGEDRIGLVTFARYADLLCPLTLDHSAARELLRSVEPVEADGPEDATGIGTALSFAIETLERSETAAKVVVLLTDGEENVATRAAPQEIAPVHAAQLAAQLGVRVHTIVAGTGMPGRDGRVQPLDTTAVQQVAALTGGRFFRARDAQSLTAVYRAIDALEKTDFAEPKVLVREWFWAFVGLAVGLLLIVGWARTRRRGELP